VLARRDERRSAELRPVEVSWLTPAEQAELTPVLAGRAELARLTLAERDELAPVYYRRAELASMVERAVLDRLTAELARLNQLSSAELAELAERAGYCA
jgi:hypothetical protein